MSVEQQGKFQPAAPSNAGALSKPTVSATRRPWFRRYPVATLLAALLLDIITAPFDDHLKGGDLMEAVRLTVILLLALLAVGGRHKALVVGLALVCPALVLKWMNHFHPALFHPWMFLAPGLLFILLVVFYLLRFIARSRRIDSEVLCAGVAGYLLLGMLWVMLYLLVARSVPDAFAFSTGPAASQTMTGFTAVYFSFITLSTVGYGDIAPVSSVARMLAMMEAIVGVFYTAVLVARLVSLYSSSPASDPEPGRSEKL
jgi:voltage-gated potassium channel